MNSRAPAASAHEKINLAKHEPDRYDHALITGVRGHADDSPTCLSLAGAVPALLSDLRHPAQRKQCRAARLLLRHAFFKIDLNLMLKMVAEFVSHLLINLLAAKAVAPTVLSVSKGSSIKFAGSEARRFGVRLPQHLLHC